METQQIEQSEPKKPRRVIGSRARRGRGRPHGSKDSKPRRTEHPREKFAPSVWESGRAEISVEQRHIDEALRANSSHCAIAMAIADAIPHAQRIAVDLQTIRWTDKKRGVRYVFLTPHVAQTEVIIPFDQGETCKPVTFRMKPAFVTRAGSKYARHTPEPEQLKDARLKVAEEQPHISASQEVDVSQETPTSATVSQETVPQSITESRLADLMKADAPVIERRESDLDKAEMKREPPPRKPRVARAKVSATKPDGSIPTTLGGKLPPVSVLSRREFGLRALRR
jgi:hypothetical protein